MMGVPYKSVLRCRSFSSRELRYELPAHYCGVEGDYAVYYRPHPIVHHYGKKRFFTLLYPELIFVGNSLTHHCISVAFDGDVPKNMYVNINLPPVLHDYGHEWEDLELDIKATIDNNGWYPSVVDIDEFEEASFSQPIQKLAWTEIEILLNKCAKREFPFILSWQDIFHRQKKENLKKSLL